MKIHIFAALFLSISMQVFGQYKNAFAQEKEKEAQFTMASVKRYNVIHELNGQEFIPAGYQVEQGDISKIKAGEIKIKLLENKVIIAGVENLGAFTIASKFPDRVGYIYELMDMNNKPARFKVVVDQDKYVQLLYFYSKTLGEHTFFLAEQEEAELEADKTYFTLKSTNFVRVYSNLIDKKIIPYSTQKSNMIGNEPEKISRGQNIFFEFHEKDVVTPVGTFEIKKASTFAFSSNTFPAVKSMIEIETKGKGGKITVYLNFKQQVEFIETDNTLYFLMP